MDEQTVPEHTDPRADFIAGLRELADYIEAEPDAPTPDWTTTRAWFRTYGPDAKDRDAFLAAARLVGGEVEVKHGNVEVIRAFGPVEYVLQMEAKAVCVEREVTRSEFVLPEELEALAGDSEAVAR